MKKKKAPSFITFDHCLSEAEVNEIKEKWEKSYGGSLGMRETTEFNFKFYLVIATVITALVVAHELKYFP